MTRQMRREDKEMENKQEIQEILLNTKYVTIAMCKDNEPYLVTLSHGYDKDENCLYFHCASEGKKIEFLKQNSTVWGQALIDKGYVHGTCDHLYAAAHFRGEVRFLENVSEKESALKIMIRQLDDKPEKVMAEQLKEESVKNVTIGRIDIDYLSGKKADEVIISL
ncbi:MAG: pyridoxamine 5'-phosphate oxidase family protein [Candidatus Thorarchaeota archaeon]|nr:pyridoxamine 5'-phosphate oxidase family protein [Candidatus Thorarchaeota archaeon]